MKVVKKDKTKKPKKILSIKPLLYLKVIIFPKPAKDRIDINKIVIKRNV